MWNCFAVPLSAKYSYRNNWKVAKVYHCLWKLLGLILLHSFSESNFFFYNPRIIMITYVVSALQLKLFFPVVTFAKPKSSRNSSIGKVFQFLNACYFLVCILFPLFIVSLLLWGEPLFRNLQSWRYIETAVLTLVKFDTSFSIM